MISRELLSLAQRLQRPEQRREAVRELAARAGAKHVLLFGKDLEIGAYLPALGLPQTLRQGARWQSFLNRCASADHSSGVLPDPDGDDDLAAFCVADSECFCMLVFLGAAPDESMRGTLAELLALLGPKLIDERIALAATGHAAAAREATRKAEALNTALDKNRYELRAAIERAEAELASRRAAENQLREADRRKDEFLAMLAHELRNPLAPIGAAAELLGMAQFDEARIRQIGKIIARQVNHMSSLVDDLLDVSRVTRGLVEIERRPVDIGRVLSDALEQAAPLLQGKHHRLELHPPPEPVRVLGDAKRLVQVVANLLNNAAKFTPEKGNIVLRAEVGADRVSLHVSDDGIGMEPALVPRVFDLFAQNKRNADRSQGGLGLGLALVKSLVELHGGSVQAYSRGSGSGSEFTVSLPRLAQQEQEPGPDAAGDPLPHARPLRILIVDDNIDAAQTLAMVLQASGHEVLIEHDADSAIERAEAVLPDVCMLDIGVPGMDGNELARRLRASPQTAATALIAVTGYGQEYDRTVSLAAGFDHYLVKPADTKKLLALLSEIGASDPGTARGSSGRPREGMGRV